MTRKQFIDFAKRMTKAFVDIANEMHNENSEIDLIEDLSCIGALELPAAIQSIVYVKDYHDKKNQWIGDKMFEEDSDEILNYYFDLLDNEA